MIENIQPTSSGRDQMFILNHKIIPMKLFAICLLLLSGAYNTFAQDLSVLTYNLRYATEADGENRWENRRAFLISQLRFYKPDIFGTQEGLVHQLQAIRDGLEDYDYFGKGRDKGDQAGEFSAVFYNKGIVNLLEEQTFWLSETPEVPSKGWDAALNRVCTYGLFESRQDGRKFYVFNTHLDHMGETARTESVRLLLEKIAAINKAGLPVILMGDFNLEPDHEAIKALGEHMQDAHLLAGADVFGPEGTFNGFVVTEAATRRIDYIFLSPSDYDLMKYGILTATIEGRHPSDHFPVYAELNFK